ncbi:MAG: putative lipid II flippase FtsW [Deltaproteobacteria bacterium]|nr:MAG: putative lipid II flippase FtsW [Deltaproteobacteria bacterium]
MREGMAIDGWILLAVAVLLAVGITMVLSTSYLYSQERFSDGTYFFRKQLVAAGVGLVALVISALFPSAAYRRIAYPLLGLSLVILTIVLVPGIGLSRGGARRWLPLGGFAFQPGELAKISLVLYLAHSLAKKREMIRTFTVGVLPHLIVGGLFLGLILLEPDLGTALMLGLILFLMLFVGGIKASHLLMIGSMALPVLALALIGAEYRLRRLFAFVDPWRDASNTGFQIIQSYIAFGSGQLWGRGLGESRQKLFYLPEAHTDFIFSVIGEELGLLGALVVLALFAVIVVRGLRMTARIEEPFCQYLAFGLTTLLGLQALIHMGVAMGLLPTKGLVLPFISYGGSAMVMNLTEAGILLSLSRRRL